MKTIILAVSLIFAPAQVQKNQQSEQFKKAFNKAIKDGHVNKLCQDLKGTWETVEGTESFKLCRPANGVLNLSKGHAMVLVAFSNPKNRSGNITIDIFDCAGNRRFHDRMVHYDSTGKIIGYDAVALGGEWEDLIPNSQGEAVLQAACRDIE